ncbi:membrane protein [Pandoraea apista]|uniref:Membrane protein n=2 Tax=Pandoraea apista TaxID=93218 RepID=A0A5E5P701_9BURK|nr:membrane protein [Pandoraea apista]
MTATPPDLPQGADAREARVSPRTRAASATSATSATSAMSATPHGAQALRRLSIASLLALIVLSVAWELWLAPLRPGGSWLVLKALLLLLPLRGVLRGNLYTLQWSSMFILLFLAEGVVRGMSDTGASASLAWVETALSVVFFFSTIFYLRPFKRAAKARAATAR